MKIYTKTGDTGTTSLFGGKRVNKTDARIKAYGTVDELNSLIGVIVSGLEAREKAEPNNKIVKILIGKLLRIQNELMVLGSDLATPFGLKIKSPRVENLFTKRLEKEIDSWESYLKPLKNFVLPGGSIISSWVHLARSTTRRAEREIANLNSEEKINQDAVKYINRLSDWFFVLARYINKEESSPEKIWLGRKSIK